MPRPKPGSKLLRIVIAVLALAGVIGAAWWFRPHAFHGTVIQSPESAPDFTLTSIDGPVSLHDYRGKIVLLYFGYTFCPDVCPATLANVGRALHLLGDQADRVQLIMVSVDPERDTPEKLAEYVAHFHPSFIGVTGSPEEIAQIAALYGIYYEKSEGSESTGYLVNHTATLMVVDPEGRLKLVFPFGTTAEEIADDLRYMLRR